MTCKNCFNYETCKRYEKLFHKYITGLIKADRDCEDFQDRSLWVKLPCKVGDAVYQIDNAGRIYESVVTKIIYDTPIISFDKNAVGVSIFLTREEAERALKERENNDK